MRGIIIYQSNYGATRQYAEWLSADTRYPLRESKSVSRKELLNYDQVLIGCPVFANQPLLKSWIKKQWSILAKKQVILFTTSGTPGDDPALLQGFDQCFIPEIHDHIRYFPLGGRIILDQLKPLHRFLMRLGMKMEKDPRVRAEMAKDKDNVDRESLKALLSFIQAA